MLPLKILNAIPLANSRHYVGNKCWVTLLRVESIWANEGLCLSPNVNLVTYNGYADGTNTLRRARWPELPIGELTTSCGEPTFDLKADQWIHKVVFRGDIAGVLTGPFESLALEIRNRYRKREKSK